MDRKFSTPTTSSTRGSSPTASPTAGLIVSSQNDDQFAATLTPWPIRKECSSKNVQSLDNSYLPVLHAKPDSCGGANFFYYPEYKKGQLTRMVAGVYQVVQHNGKKNSNFQVRCGASVWRTPGRKGMLSQSEEQKILKTAFQRFNRMPLLLGVQGFKFAISSEHGHEQIMLAVRHALYRYKAHGPRLE